jgi:hypothetical protein
MGVVIEMLFMKYLGIKIGSKPLVNICMYVHSLPPIFSGSRTGYPRVNLYVGTGELHEAAGGRQRNRRQTDDTSGFGKECISITGVITLAVKVKQDQNTD